LHAAVSGDIERQFETAPDTEFIEGIAQVILYDLLGSTDYTRDFAVGLAFPDQHRDLNFLGG
jgi:hypothetical protein